MQYIHAPRIISQGEFSAAISLRSRHLVDQNKNKENTFTDSTKKQHKKHSQNKQADHSQRTSSPQEVLMENVDCQ